MIVNTGAFDHMDMIEPQGIIIYCIMQVLEVLYGKWIWPVMEISKNIIMEHLKIVIFWAWGLC